jgi:hypothetical protein
MCVTRSAMTTGSVTGFYLVGSVAVRDFVLTWADLAAGPDGCPDVPARRKASSRRPDGPAAAR